MPEHKNKLLMLVTYKTKPGLREAFYETIVNRKLQDACRQEEGNLSYDYFRSVDDQDELLLVEKWIDQAALDLHKTLPHFKQLQDLKMDFIAEMSVIITTLPSVK